MPASPFINPRTDTIPPLSTCLSFVVLSQVAKVLEENVGDGAADSPRPLWEGVKISVGPRCKHLCLFTQARWRNLALKRPSWFKLFGEFVSFLGGNGKEAARQLIAALSKDSGVEYDPAYAQQMEDWQRERLKKFGLFGYGESSSSTRSFPCLCSPTRAVLFSRLGFSRHPRLIIFPRRAQGGPIAGRGISSTISRCGAAASIRNSRRTARRT